MGLGIAKRCFITWHGNSFRCITLCTFTCTRMQCDRDGTCMSIEPAMSCAMADPGSTASRLGGQSSREDAAACGCRLHLKAVRARIEIGMAFRRHMMRGQGGLMQVVKVKKCHDLEAQDPCSPRC